MYHELHAVQRRIDALHQEAARERMANEARRAAAARRAESGANEPEGRVNQRRSVGSRLLGPRGRRARA
ncbi:hypothetical protein [Streptomyces hainanensis]|uniref:Uncharacterized protein n=1 Tax=Streptomyces hainanensis TaxID=402648 RepID=A0A4R4SQT5_9ACTN|nr:hypothetical protein [Streptomyces hainanensis]TDC65406.1 hypothetical protein E1283_30670 [Streptomyces hainanensis]